MSKKSSKSKKMNLGFNLSVKKEDFSELVILLNSANKKLIEEKKIRFFIDRSHECPNSENNLVKIQFKNIPLNVDKERGKKIFQEFGDIEDLYHKEGIWTILYTKIIWILPFMFQKQLETGSKNRWFKVEDTYCSFSSKTTCLNCKIKGHIQQSCPGETLISKLRKETNKTIKETPKKESPNQNQTPKPKSQKKKPSSESKEESKDSQQEEDINKETLEESKSPKVRKKKASPKKQTKK